MGFFGFIGVVLIVGILAASVVVSLEEQTEQARQQTGQTTPTQVQQEQPKTLRDKVLDLSSEIPIWYGDIKDAVPVIVSLGITDDDEIIAVLRAAGQLATVCGTDISEMAALVAQQSIAFNRTPHDVANTYFIANQKLCEARTL